MVLICGRVAQNGNPEQFEFFSVPLSIWIKVAAFCPETGYFVAVFDNITEQKNAEEALKRSTTRLKDAQQLAKIGCFHYDFQKDLTWWSDELYRLYGREPDNKPFSRQKANSYSHPDDHQVGANMIQQAIKSGAPVENEYRIVWPDGSIRYHHSISRVTIDSDKNPLEIHGTVQDVTDWKLAEKARHQIEEKLNQAQKLDSLGVLAGGIAHDFNNLLGGIYGCIELARKETKEEGVCQFLESAMNTMERAIGLTQQFQTFSKGGAPIREVGPLFPFIQESALFAASGSSVSCHFEVEKGLWLADFDKTQMSQVIDNLIINAIQAMPSGGTIRITAKNIRLSAKQHPVLSGNRFVQISIKDSGMGIPPEIIGRIFEPFFTTKEKGHGLGLATCYSIIHRHNGTLEVESEPDKGSIFHIYLPASSEKRRKPKEKKVAHHFGHGTILIMDNEPAMRMVLAGMVESLGYRAICHDDGMQVVARFAKALQDGERIGAIIVDLTVPGGKGGRDIIQAIRKLNDETPVFVTSGYADDPVLANPAEFGFTAGLRKPFSLTSLTGMLERFVK